MSKFVSQIMIAFTTKFNVLFQNTKKKCFLIEIINYDTMTLLQELWTTRTFRASILSTLSTFGFLATDGNR